MSDLPTTTVKVLEPLTPEEESERHRLELKVERAFYEAGAALLQLREYRLYRSTHKTFEEYCRERFGFTRQNANYLIAGSQVVENLTLTTNGCQILPTSERQVRPLTTLEPDKQRQVWQQAVEEAGGKVPSGRIIKGIVERLKARPVVKATDAYKKDDVFSLTGLVGGERKYNGCWAIAVMVNEYSVNVLTYDGILSQMKPDNLKPIDLPQECEFLQVLAQRIQQIRARGLLDRGAYSLLEHLGKQRYLTEVEEKLLECLEEYYSIK